MYKTLDDVTDADLSSTGLFLSLSLRTPSGALREIYKRPAHELVSTVDHQSTLDTMTRIQSECLYAGIECSLPQALAAAYSVPDGAPIGMAILNVGPPPSDLVIERHSAMQARTRANVAAVRRGMCK